MSILETQEGLQQPENPLITDFKNSLRPRSPEYKAGLADQYRSYYEQILHENSQRTEEDLRATGELPREVTPFDVINSPRQQTIEEVLPSLVNSHIYSEVFTHPLIIETFKAEEKKGWEPVPPKQSDVLDKCIREKSAVTYEDFALSISEDEPDEDSAQVIFGNGLVSHGTTDTPSFRISGSSMSALVSAQLQASLAIAGSMSFTSMDGRWKDPQNVARMINRGYELVTRSPLVQSHQDRDYIINRAIGLMGVTIKADPEEALEAIKLIFDQCEYLDGHNLLVRLYDPRSMPRMIHTVDALMNSKFGERLNIIGGKVTKPSQMEELAKAGSKAFDVGIGEGEICDTPGVTASTANNVLTAYRCAQLGLPIPMIVDGGTGRQIPVAIALGASTVMKSQALSGGTYEQNPVGWIYQDKNGGLFKQYFGEASEAEKYPSKLDATGEDVMFNEGRVGKIPWSDRFSTAIKRLYKFNESLATAAVFQRVNSLNELQRNPQPDIWMYTSHAASRASVHH